jgi:hypothetical protein
MRSGGAKETHAMKEHLLIVLKKPMSLNSNIAQNDIPLDQTDKRRHWNGVELHPK